MTKGVDEADVYVLFLSKGVALSAYTQLELATALQLEKRALVVADDDVACDEGGVASLLDEVAAAMRTNERIVKPATDSGAALLRALGGAEWTHAFHRRGAK